MRIASVIDERGALRHIAEVQTPSEVRTAAGGYRLVWGTESTRRAEWRTGPGGREVFETHQVHGLADAVLVLDQPVAISERNRIKLTDTATGEVTYWQVRHIASAEGLGRKLLVYVTKSSEETT